MKKKIRHLWQLVSLEALAISVLFLLSVFAFSYIVHEAVYEKEDLFDSDAIRYFSAHATPGFIEVMKRLSFFGSTTFLFPAYLVLIAWLVSKKRIPLGIDIAVISLSSTAMMFALKQFFHRQRPALPILKGVTGYSFPSGHALSSIIFCSILIYLVWQGATSVAIKYLLTFLLLLLAFSIGLSRVVLNVHYATDVIGGFCAGIIWVILSFAVLQKIREKSISGTSTPAS